MGELIYRDTGSIASPRKGSSVWEGIPGLAESISNAALNVYKAQATRDSVQFGNQLDMLANNIFLRNQNNPSGFQKDFQSAADELRGSFTTKGMSDTFDSFIKRKETQYMIQISHNTVMQETEETERILQDQMGSSMNSADVSGRFLSDLDSGVREFAVQSSGEELQNTLNMLSAPNAINGKPIVNSAIAMSFVKDYENSFNLAVLKGHLSRAQNKADVEKLKAQWLAGELETVAFDVAYDDKNGHNVKQVKRSKISGSTRDPIYDKANEMLSMAMEDIERREVRNHWNPLLSSQTRTGRINGIPQQIFDDWVTANNSYFQVDDREERISRIRSAASIGLFPSQAKATVKGAIVSGDNDSIQVALDWVESYYQEDGAILAKAFSDDEETLAKALTLMGRRSTLSQMSNDVQRESMKAFMAPVRQDHSYPDQDIAGLIDDYYRQQNSWKGRLIYGAEEDPSDSRDALEHVARLQWDRYLGMTNGDLDGAKKMLFASLGTIAPSNLSSTGRTLMTHRPEDYIPYPGGSFNDPVIRDRVVSQMHEIAASSIKTMEAQSVIPEGSELVGSYLASWDETEEGAEKLKAAGRRGLDYYLDNEGRVAYSPTYLHMVRYRYGGVEHEIPVGYFNPSVEAQRGRGR